MKKVNYKIINKFSKNDNINDDMKLIFNEKLLKVIISENKKII